MTNLLVFKFQEFWPKIKSETYNFSDLTRNTTFHMMCSMIFFEHGFKGYIAFISVALHAIHSFFHIVFCLINAGQMEFFNVYLELPIFLVE